MSLDRSLKVGGSLAAHRNVLTRPERCAKLAEKGQFDWKAGTPTGLPKVANRKVTAGAKPKKKEEAAAGAAPAAGAAAPAATPAAAAPAKGKK